MAYILGFFAADGTMIKNKRGAHFVEFNSTDFDVIYKIRKHFKSNHKISTRVGVKSNYKIDYRLQIGSREMFSDLEKLGFTPNKSLKMRFPKIPIAFLSHFVRGYFDGDGCVSIGRFKFKERKVKKLVITTRFTSGSKKFLEGLHLSLKQIVRGGCLARKEHGFELIFSHLDTLALYGFLYNNVTKDLYLLRKYKKFRSVIKAKYPQNLLMRA